MNNQSTATVAAVIAAAGRSRRMGRPKQLLPWGESTVIATVVETLHQAGAAPIVCVAGHEADQLQDALRDSPAQVVYNAMYRTGEMLSSLQAGVQSLLDTYDLQSPTAVPVLAPAAGRPMGTLLALGDQPHLGVAHIRRILAAARAAPEKILFPSYNMRRGHPFYVPVRLWPQLLALTEQETMRTLIRNNEADIAYVTMPDDAVLRDMDTPTDYASLAQIYSRSDTNS